MALWQPRIRACARCIFIDRKIKLSECRRGGIQRLPRAPHRRGGLWLTPLFRRTWVTGATATGAMGTGIPGKGTIDIEPKGRARPAVRGPTADPGHPGPGPARCGTANQPAAGVILTASFFASLGSGIVTSTTPSCVFALICLALVPTGSAIEREKDP